VRALPRLAVPLHSSAEVQNAENIQNASQPGELTHWPVPARSCGVVITTTAMARRRV